MTLLNYDALCIDSVIEKLKDLNVTTAITTNSGRSGMVVEDASGIKPNNNPHSDTPTFEIKSSQGICDITLFSKRPERGDTYRIVEEYGYIDKKNRQAFATDISDNSSKLFCYADTIGVGIYDSITKEEICYWGYEYLEVGFSKIKNILKVLVKRKKLENENEEHSVRAIDSFGTFKLNKFIDFINDGTIVICPSRYFKSNIPNPKTGRYPSRDRGCKFRIDQKHFKYLYETQITH